MDTMTFHITSKAGDAIIYSTTARSMKEAVEDAVSKGVDLRVSVVTFFDGFLVKLFDGCDLANYTLPLFPSE